MIDRYDHVELPAGVAIARGSLHDEVRGTDHALNRTATLYLSLLVSGLSVGEIGDTVSRRIPVGKERVMSDVTTLVWALNQRGLVNVRRRGLRGRWGRGVATLVMAAMTQRLAVLTRRREVQMSNRRSIVVSIFNGVVTDHIGTWVAIVVGASVLAASSSLRILPTVLVAVMVLAGALVVHEAGHAWAVHRRGAPCCLVTSGLRCRVVHGVDSQTRLIHAAGSLGAVGAGIGLIAVALIANQVLLAVAAAPFIIQLGGLTVLGQDGRRLLTGQ